MIRPVSKLDARKGTAMRTLGLSTVGAVCALLMVVCFVIGIALMASSGVQVLIPETGEEGLEWIADVDDAGGIFFVGAWLTILGGLLGAVALIGFYDALRSAGPVLILAPILGAIGLTLVTISHLIPIGMAYELVPGYVDAEAATRSSLAVTTDTLAILSLAVNYTGNALGWGVAVPLFAFAILKTSVVPRWIGWLGFVVAVFGGWLGLLGPASSVIEEITVIGFLGFFVWMASMGVALLRCRAAAAEDLSPASAH
jgi:hypothetical protein